MTADAAAMPELLDALKRKSRRHAWLAGTASTLAALLAICLMTVLVVYTAAALGGHRITFVLDRRLTEFGVTSAGGRNGWQVRLSGITPLLLMIGSGVSAFFAKRERVAVTRTVAEHDDVRATGQMIEALFLRDRAVRRIVSGTLLRNLPRLTSDDAALISDHQRQLLKVYLGRARWFQTPDGSDLATAIVRAYSVIGNGTEIGVVRRLAAGRGGASRDARVAEAARVYLDEVQRKAEAERSRQTLLRPAAADGPGDLLLRAARGSSDTPPDRLLRPASEDAPDRTLQ